MTAPEMEHDKNTKTTTLMGLAQFLKSMANDDILSEIFTRLPNTRDALNCAAVCTRWHSLISHPDFPSAFKRRRIGSAPAFTILFRKTLLFEEGEFFSGESATLHGPLRSERRGGVLRYLNFLGYDSVVILSSWKDLLLLQLPPAPRRPHLCICNPLTRQWDPLPDPLNIVEPTSGTVFDLESRRYYGSLVLSSADSRRYMVVLIVYNAHSEWLCVDLAVFRSETGKWDDHLVRLALEWPVTWLPYTVVDAADGIVYLPMVTFDAHFVKISGFDPRAPMGSYFEIGLPQGLQHGWEYETHFGVTKGKMRIWQTYGDETSQKFVLNVWQRNGKCEEWSSVIQAELETSRDGDDDGLGCDSRVVALDPTNDYAFFFVNPIRPSLQRYDIQMGIYTKIRSVGSVLFDSNVITLEHPSWPTQIPQIPLLNARISQTQII